MFPVQSWRLKRKCWTNLYFLTVLVTPTPFPPTPLEYSRTERAQVSGYFDSDLGKVMCQVLFSMSCRTQELYEGKSKGVAFHGINSRENSYKFDSIWMQDTLLLTHRSAQDHM